ncbi:hypothetical protein TRIP_B200233 [uncultured Desulfatiglans sp.]|nr:hypothetical protein TRIP_B200233 [uncultured Desulfatiglans sp.]
MMGYEHPPRLTFTFDLLPYCDTHGNPPFPSCPVLVSPAGREQGTPFRGPAYPAGGFRSIPVKGPRDDFQVVGFLENHCAKGLDVFRVKINPIMVSQNRSDRAELLSNTRKGGGKILSQYVNLLDHARTS